MSQNLQIWLGADTQLWIIFPLTFHFWSECPTPNSLFNVSDCNHTAATTVPPKSEKFSHISKINSIHFALKFHLLQSYLDSKIALWHPGDNYFWDTDIFSGGQTSNCLVSSWVLSSSAKVLPTRESSAVGDEWNASVNKWTSLAIGSIQFHLKAGVMISFDQRLLGHCMIKILTSFLAKTVYVLFPMIFMLWRLLRRHCRRKINIDIG